MAEPYVPSPATQAVPRMHPIDAVMGALTGGNMNTEIDPTTGMPLVTGERTAAVQTPVDTSGEDARNRQFNKAPDTGFRGPKGNAPPTAVQPNVAAGAQPSTPAEAPFTTYESTNPESQYDQDIRFTHSLSRALGLAGLGDKAAGARDLHMKLQSARIGEIADNAQRAFVAGDITKGIDMFNHAVPNGNKITGYRKEANGTITFQTADGKTENRKPDDLAAAISVYGKPEINAALLQTRAKSLYDMNSKMAEAAFKGSIDLNIAQQKNLMSAQNAMALKKYEKEFDRDYGPGRLTVGTDGTPYWAAHNGSAFRIDMKPSKLNPKVMEPVPTQIIAPTGGQSSGYQFNPGAVTAVR